MTHPMMLIAIFALKVKGVYLVHLGDMATVCSVECFTLLENMLCQLIQT